MNRDILSLQPIKQEIAKAWINYDGNTGTSVIRNSFNVRSLTDNGTGNFTVTFARAFSSANYTVATACSAGSRVCHEANTTSSATIVTRDASAVAANAATVCAVFTGLG